MAEYSFIKLFTKLYPYHTKKRSCKLYRAVLGIGGNIGDVPRRFNHLFYYLKKSPFVDIIETAPILKNPPFGYINQSYFHNSVIVISTNLQPKALLRYILHCEKRFGRTRSFKDAPRTLDIDMIFYENRVIESRDLTLPHPHWHKRDSVLIPLKYLKSKI
ncbi:2-amino-4-hydroxy-6-hydroxymethyldihydropteridine diphosphokinase [Sulfurovum sp. bin170]|uniref:2-amino-4-hydroxy-6- hydroxymethyldihydropteridine diphosphokinase n=1 Tax=Sulfurovum sp. bin170 TaxID=2695268 RepID=UPI001CB74409|nr:2-amino-4-hydroxy-6-hydroxymethyldihydropteridine diphosphokinase [Sulfurovum sp. bin170]